MHSSRTATRCWRGTACTSANTSKTCPRFATGSGPTDAVQILCLNAGSSSLKAASFDDTTGDPVRVMSEHVERVADDHARALDRVAPEIQPDVVAHRFVHGGPDLVEHAVIDDRVRATLDAAVPLAPLHLPGALAVLKAAEQRWPDAPNIACFDTVFHSHLLPESRRLPI